MPRLNNPMHIPPLARRVRPFRAVALAAVVVFVLVNLVIPSSSAPTQGPSMTPAAMDAWFDGVVRDAAIPGAAIVVVQDGRIVDAHGYGVADDTGRPVGADTPFVIGSLAKSLTGLAVAQLAERGRLDLDAPVRRYLPEFTVADTAAADSITVRQLLDQTSGLPGAAGTAPLSFPATSLEAQVRALATVDLASAPGTAFTYSNANYVVLGRLIEVVSHESYESFMQANVFEPLGMSHTTSVLATAKADGLGQAHRLWFGLPDSHAPLFREDLAPAGFVASSAHDLANVLIAEMDGGRFGSTVVASPATIAMLWKGAAPAGPSGSYAMGWFDGMFEGQRIVSHAGSTTDMASFQAIVPSKGLGVVVLFNAQSVLYEELHKPDSIGLAAVAHLMGFEGPGTQAFFYPAFDGFALLILGLLIRNLIRTARAPIVPRSRPWPVTWRGRAVVAGRIYLDGLVPLALVTETPVVLGAGWAVLLRIDLGLVVAALATLRLLDGALRVARTVAALRMRREVPARFALDGTVG
jgi:CubicO group peptidase (beta-lactamase class C family)